MLADTGKQQQLDYAQDTPVTAHKTCAFSTLDIDNEGPETDQAVIVGAERRKSRTSPKSKKFEAADLKSWLVANAGGGGTLVQRGVRQVEGKSV